MNIYPSRHCMLKNYVIRTKIFKYWFAHSSWGEEHQF